MNKIIVLHDKFSDEPVVVRISAINAVRKDFDVTGDGKKEYSDVLIGQFFLSVNETIGTILKKIKKIENEE